MRVLAIVSGKGGVGKTVTAVALAALAAQAGKRVVLIDADPVGGAGWASGFEREHITLGLADVLRGTIPAPNTLLDTEAGYRLMPATAELIQQESKARNTLARALAVPDVDLFVIDTPPGFGQFSQGSAVAATDVVVPVHLEPLAVRTISHVLGMLDALQVRDKLRGVVITEYEPRRAVTQQQRTELEGLIDVPVLAEIPRTVSAAEAPLLGKPVTLYAPRSTAAAGYRILAERLGLYSPLL